MLFAFYAMVIMCKGILAEGKQFNGQIGELSLWKVTKRELFSLKGYPLYVDDTAIFFVAGTKHTNEFPSEVKLYNRNLLKLLMVTNMRQSSSLEASCREDVDTGALPGHATKYLGSYVIGEDSMF